MTEPYLILHKVRGEPAFDIAERIEVDGEEWWIIPTSGHRAYPYWDYKLDDLGADLSYPGEPEFVPLGRLIHKMPEGWPDHYACNDRPSKLDNAIQTGRSILAAIGLAPPTTEIKRRKF